MNLYIRTVGFDEKNKTVVLKSKHHRPLFPVGGGDVDTSTGFRPCWGEGGPNLQFWGFGLG